MAPCPPERSLWTEPAWAMWAAWCCGTVVCVNLSSQDGSVVSGPDIITRGFIYVKESEDLMEELKQVAMEAIDRCQRKRVRDWSAIKSAIKNDISGYLFKTTKRNPMILPVIMEI